MLLEMQMIDVVCLKIWGRNTDGCTSVAIKKHPELWFLKTAECNFGYRHTLSFCVASLFLTADCMTFTSIKYEHFCFPATSHVNVIRVTCSSSFVLQLWWSLGLLTNSFLCEAILDLFCPFYKFRLFHIISDIIFPSGLGSSYLSTCRWFAFVYFTDFTILISGILFMCPTQSLSFNIIYYVSLFY
jgi:hypothetical protein